MGARDSLLWGLECSTEGHGLGGCRAARVHPALTRLTPPWPGTVLGTESLDVVRVGELMLGGGLPLLEGCGRKQREWIFAKPERDPVHCRPGSSARGLPGQVTWTRVKTRDPRPALEDFCESHLGSEIQKLKTEMDRTRSGKSLNSEGNGGGRRREERGRVRRAGRPRKGLEAGQREREVRREEGRGRRGAPRRQSL